MAKQDGGISIGGGGVDVTSLLSRALNCLRQHRGQEAADFLNQALEAESDNPEVHHLTGLLYQQQGMLNEARAFLERAAEWAPENPNYHLNLGVTMADLGETDAAIACFRTAIDRRPDYAFAYGNLGISLTRKGDVPAALDAFEEAIALQPDYPQAQQGLGEVLGRVLTEANEPGIEAALVRAFRSILCDHANLAPAAARQLELKYDLPEGRGGIDASDSLLVQYLTKCINISVPLEVFLTGARRNLLLAGTDALDDKDQALAALLAQQCFLNEYVWFRDDDEKAAVAALRDRLDGALGANPDMDAVRAALLLVAMYGPLNTLAGGSTLAHLDGARLGEAIAPIVQMTVCDYLEETRLKDTIPTVGAITDTTSRAVRGMYEENPYPRWVHAPKRVHSALATALRRAFPHFTLPDFLGAPLNVLIAGCGTGQQVVNTVARTPPGSRVTALDLSKASLAYAMRMARKLGIKDVAFIQADILDLHDLDGTFDLIESVGVLHHMKRPVDGIRALAERLRPGGLLRLGLYRKRGRAAVDRCHHLIAAEKIGAEPDDIARFRHRLIHDPPVGDFTKILEPMDFFCTSMCRDFLFHVQEECYTPKRLKDELASIGLAFIGFEGLEETGLEETYAGKFPDDTAKTDLNNWEALEQTWKDLPAGYIFWCQKPGNESGFK